MIGLQGGEPSPGWIQSQVQCVAVGGQYQATVLRLDLFAEIFIGGVAKKIAGAGKFPLAYQPPQCFASIGFRITSLYNVRHKVR